MPATAAARRPVGSTRRRSAGTAAKRRPPAPRRPAAGRAALVPLAIGRTAVAVRGIADSGFVVRLTRGRLWIGALATLLVGIVALNVAALQLSASSSRAALQADGLNRQNSALRAELATEVSSERMQRTAERLGLIVPEPGAIRYLRPSADDAAAAAKRLRDRELGGAEYVAAAPVAPPAPVEDVAAPPPPAAVGDPVASDSAETIVDPVATTPDPTTAPPAPPAGGGVASP